MAGTNVVRIKQALIAFLRASDELTARPELEIDYSPRTRHLPREYLYLGNSRFDHSRTGHKGGAARQPRSEVANVDLHIEAWMPGATQEEMDDAATEIGVVVEHLLAENFNLATEGTALAGLQFGGVEGGELTPVTGDTGTGALLSYRLSFTSRLS
jgi:hypothetical protein